MDYTLFGPSFNLHTEADTLDLTAVNGKCCISTCKEGADIRTACNAAQHDILFDMFVAKVKTFGLQWRTRRIDGLQRIELA